MRSFHSLRILRALLGHMDAGQAAFVVFLVISTSANIAHNALVFHFTHLSFVWDGISMRRMPRFM